MAQPSFIYIVTSPDKKKLGEFKIGKHTGPVEKLLEKRNTYFIPPIIEYCIEVSNPELVLNHVLGYLDYYRIQNHLGIKTSLVLLPVEKIISTILYVIDGKNPDPMQIDCYS